MKINKALFFYLALLAFHVAHVFEEAWGGFIIERALGLGWFLFVNWILFLIPLGILYLILTGRRQGYYLGIAYAVLMLLNGLGHNLMVLVTGGYFNGFAGSMSGLGLIIVSPLMIYYLRQSIPHGNKT